MGLFDGANQAALTGTKLPRLGDYQGKHLFRVCSAKAGIAQGKKRGRTYFAIEIEIVRSSNPTLQAGTKLSWAALKSPEWPEFFFSDVKRLIASAVGCKAEQVTEASMEKAVSDAQPLKGKLCCANCPPPVLKDGKSIVTVEFFPGNESADLGPMLAVAAAPAAATGATAAASATAAQTAAEDDILFG